MDQNRKLTWTDHESNEEMLS